MIRPLSFLPPFFALVLFLSAALQAEEDKLALPDAELIRGAWRVVTAKDEGRPKPRVLGQIDRFDTARLHRVSTDGRRTVYRYELDPAAQPKRLILSTDDELISITAIYKLEGDTLTLCYSYQPGVVPTEFTTKLKDSRTLLVLKRDTDH